jgi:hypothetical protein
MSVSMIYRTVAGLLLLFALGHTLGFNHVDPGWGVNAPIDALQTIRFTAQGTPNRTYWGFYLGFGYFCSALLVLAMALAWQVARLSREALREMRFILWSFAVVFLATTCMTWIFFFTAPKVFSSLITIALFGGAWRAQTA